MAFAGANRRREAGRDEDDGILTALEIGALDLRGVSWVVLSGCETGAGEVRRAEGVLGLRRGFTIAGAGTVVMSLWRVEDDIAQRAMGALYHARFKDGLDTPEAMRAAAQAVRDHLRSVGRDDGAWRWAAFVASGPLEGAGPR
jgi:CHAT domain-containing protein